MQTNTKGLSTREKKMLLFLAVFGTTALMVVFVIMPYFNRLQDERDALNALEMEQMRINILLASEQTLINNFDDAFEHYSETTQALITESHISEIGRMLTRICQEHGLMPIEQRLSNPVVFTDSDARDDDGGVLSTVSVSMSVRGSYNDLKRLLNTIEQTEYLRISRVSFSIGDDRDVTERIALNFEVVMLRELE
jgi:hypothetical protein